MSMLRERLLLLGLLALGACAAQCSPPAQPHPPPVEAGTAADCEAACQRLTDLDCPEAQPTPDGGSCVDVCRNAEGTGYVTLDPHCIAQGTTCAAVGACVWQQ